MSLKNERSLLLAAVKGDESAVEFLEMVFNLSQVMDDLFDQDKPIDKNIIVKTWWNVLIELPRNRFYQDNFTVIIPLLQRSMADWIAANSLEKGCGLDKMVAYTLRDSISSLVTDCAYLIGGYEWGNEVSKQLRKSLHTESFEDYRDGLEAT